MEQRADISSKYEMIYGNVDAAVTKFLAKTDLPPLEAYSALKALTEGVWAAVAHLSRGATREESIAFINAHLAKETSWSSDGEVRHGTVAERRAHGDAVCADIIAACAREADLVLDLGCGWGHRMVDVFLRGVKAQFYGGDRSQHSRNLCRSVAALFPEMRVDWFAFDFLEPDFAGVIGNYSNVCVFTCHAIEQVEFLGSAFLHSLFQRFPDTKITGVHLEPVAPQIDSTQTQLADHLNRLRYNKDLLRVLRDDPRLEVVEAVPIIFTSSTAIPTSLVHWQSK